MKNILQNIFRRSRGDEALTKKETPGDSAQSQTNSHIISPIRPIRPISPIAPASEDKALPSPITPPTAANSKLITQNSTLSDPEHALVGKIARLPDDIREELNQRLHNGQGGPEILAWLNELPSVKEILATQFDGKPVNSQNLSNWHHGGYERWLRQKQSINSAEKLGKYAKEFTNAAGGRFGPAVAAFSAAKIFEYFDKVKVEELSPEDLARLGMVSSVLLKGEQNYTKLELARERIRQKDELIIITRDKFQRECVGLVLRYLGDARAKAIEASGFNNEEKIETLGYHMYDDLWEPRHIPTPEDFNQPQNQQAQNSAGQVITHAASSEQGSMP